MSTSAALLATLLATAPAVAKPCLPDPPGTAVPAGGAAAIRRAEVDWAASVARNEAVFLRRFAADDFVAVFDGKVIGRAALIAAADQRRPGTAADTLERLRVPRSGVIAVAEGTETWSETGRRRRIVWSDLWVHCGGAWRLVTATSVGAPAD